MKLKGNARIYPQSDRLSPILISFIIFCKKWMKKEVHDVRVVHNGNIDVLVEYLQVQ